MDETLLAELIDRARAVAERAYVPASGYRVGATVLAEDGEIYAGCNVENASLGLTICAERSAVCQAVAAGARALRAVVVSTPGRKPAAPCGACRQVLAEFGTDMQVVLVGDEEAVVHTTLDTLLPRPFTFRAPGETA